MLDFSDTNTHFESEMIEEGRDAQMAEAQDANITVCRACLQPREVNADGFCYSCAVHDRQMNGAIRELLSYDTPKVTEDCNG